MNLNDNSVYKFESKFCNEDIYHIKLTTELLEDLENCQNINEVIINIDEKNGTLTIPYANNSSKVFNLNIEPITRGENESLEVNTFRSNRVVESKAPLNVRFNVEATPRVYDTTRKKIIGVEDENKKHRVKEIKLPLSNRNSVVNNVLHIKEPRRSEPNVVTSGSIPTNQNTTKKMSQFTFREKIIHLLALKPMIKHALLLTLNKLGCSSTELNEIDKHLQQVATINREKMYQLSSQFILDIRDDWPNFTSENLRSIAKLKTDVKSKLSGHVNNAQISKHSTISRPYNNPDEHHNSLKLSSASHSSQIGRVSNAHEKVISPRKVSETKPRELENKKLFQISPKSHRTGREDTISPAESNSSSKTIASNDEGFVSGDKRSPHKLHNAIQPTKRYSQHLLNNNSIDEPTCKKSRITDKNQSPVTYSRNEFNSSSSCDVTPKSDISMPSNTFKSTVTVNNSVNNYDAIKVNKTDIEATQSKFDTAFAEYCTLGYKVKDREAEIEKLRVQCKCANRSEYTRLHKLATELLGKLETAEFKEITTRVQKLESEMFNYVQIMTGKHRN